VASLKNISANQVMTPEQQMNIASTQLDRVLGVFYENRLEGKLLVCFQRHVIRDRGREFQCIRYVRMVYGRAGSCISTTRYRRILFFIYMYVPAFKGRFTVTNLFSRDSRADINHLH
jgi:hypothetical protein